MIELIKALILGIVQGVTEFLPISSTGHLILVEHWLGISQKRYGLAFDAALHLGTLVSIFWYFRNTWKKVLTSIIQIIKRERSNSAYNKLPLLLLVGTIPAMILGLLFENMIETWFRSPKLVAISLIVFSGVLYLVEKMVRRDKHIEELTLKESLGIGIAQAIALIPGVSRSGITIAAGMMVNLSRREAAQFAFLLSAPIVTGAGVIKLFKTLSLFSHGGLMQADFYFFIVGIISAALFGYLTIKYFLEFLTRYTLYPFIIYRIILGMVVLLFS